MTTKAQPYGFVAQPISFSNTIQSSIRMEGEGAGAGSGGGNAGGTGGGAGAGNGAGGDAGGSGGNAGAGAGAGGGNAGGNTGGAPAAFDWAKAGLDSEALGFVQQKGYKGPGDLVGAYRGAEKLLGVPADQVIKLPQGEFNQTTFNEQVANRLGRPAKATDYNLPVPTGADSNYAKQASEWFHELGLTTQQATALANKSNEYYMGQNKTSSEAAAAKATMDVTTLKANWGADYDKNTAIVDKAANTFGMNPDQLGALKNSMGPKAAMEFLLNIGNRLPTGDDPFIDGEGRQTNFQGGMSVDQAKARKGELMKDKAWVTKYGKGDTQAKAEMTRLNQIISPGHVTL
jgi:hypothetical protein